MSGPPSVDIGIEMEQFSPTRATRMMVHQQNEEERMAIAL